LGNKLDYCLCLCCGWEGTEKQFHREENRLLCPQCKTSNFLLSSFMEGGVHCRELFSRADTERKKLGILKPENVKSVQRSLERMWS